MNVIIPEKVSLAFFSKISAMEVTILFNAPLKKSDLMKHTLHITAFLLSITVILLTTLFFSSLTKEVSGAPPYGESESEVPPLDSWQQLKKNWQRPPGPPRVGLQIGHLNNEQVPEELENLRGNTGAQAGGFTEVEVNMLIAEEIAIVLRSKGIIVDILSATVPPDYWADTFVAIHADGSTDTRVSGFKIASPWRDLTGKSEQLVELLNTSYQAKTGLRKDENITRNMRGYYAFSWWRFDHSIHPMTTAVIVETGFLTNRSDRKLITEQPQIPAQALAEGIEQFLVLNGIQPSTVES